MDNTSTETGPETKPKMSGLEASLRLLIFLLMLAYSGYRALTSRDHRGFYLAEFIIFGSFFILAMTAARNPEASWVNWLFKRRFGARTDTAAMSRKELLQSGTTFLVWSAVTLGLLAALWRIGNLGSDSASITTMVLSFAGTILFLTFSAASVVLLVRGLLKKHE